jgi:hypothetical protein
MASFESSSKVDEDIKEDFLEVDPKIPGQNFVCLSFVSPEKVLKQKEVYFTTKFLEHFFNSDDQYTKDTREKLMDGSMKFDYGTIKTFYDDWKYTRNNVLDEEFYKMNDYRTTIRGLKVRGVYDTHKEANVRAQVLRRKDPNFNVFVGQIGYWLPWDPECEEVPEQEYQEEMLNDLVKKYKDNLESKDDMYEKLKDERIKKAKEEVELRKSQIKEENVNVQDSNIDVKKIEELREIVDESDKLYYENMKKNEAAKKETEAGTPVQEEILQPTVDSNIKASSETTIVEDNVEENNDSSESKTDAPNVQESNADVNNFKVENMQELESDDPWVKRKLEQQKENA